MDEYLRIISTAFTFSLVVAAVVAGRWRVGELTRKRLETALDEWREYSEGRDRLLSSLKSDLSELQERASTLRQELTRAEDKIGNVIRECHERDLYIRQLTQLLREHKIKVPPKEYEV